MAGKENHDLFSQLSSNDGSLPLDFDKNAKVPVPSGEGTEKKENISDSNSLKPSPKVEKSEQQRRPTHHVPPPYKKTVQEAAAVEPKNDVESKSDIVIQEKSAEKTDFEPVSRKDEVKKEAVKEAAAGKPVPATIPSAVQTEIPLRTPAPAVVVPAPVVAAVKAEKPFTPAAQVKTDSKPQIPDVKQQEVKSSHIPKNPAPASVKKEVSPPLSSASNDRKTPSEQKVAKTEPQKTAKKTQQTEKFSTDNATVGQLLQEGRVRCGLSIEQASTITKIKKTFIESLERDDFENLPASVYVNAYTRALCSIYNIDAKMVFSLLNKVKGKSLDHTVPEEVIQQLEKGKQVNVDQENKVKRVILIGFAACVTVITLILITYYFMHMSGKASSSHTTAKPVIISELPVQPNINTGVSAKTIEEDMEKKLMAPHVFTMTSLPLAER